MATISSQCLVDPNAPACSDSPQDLRNHGASPHHPRHDYTALAEDIEGFLAEHDLRKPTLIGHSMGAKAVMAVALRDSARVEALVSIDNAPVDAALASDFGTYVTGMRKVEEAGVRKQSDADEILQGYVEVRAFALLKSCSDLDTNHRRHCAALTVPPRATIPPDESAPPFRLTAGRAAHVAHPAAHARRCARRNGRLPVQGRCARALRGACPFCARNEEQVRC